MVIFGVELEPGFPAFVAVATAGTLGYLVGSLLGWWIGAAAGRPFLEQHGRWLHLNEAKLDKAEKWFDRWDEWAVFLGRITPVARSFISIPAGVFRMPLGRFTLLTLLGSALWCFPLAGINWALGANWEEFHHGVPLRGLRDRRARDRGARVRRLAPAAPPQALPRDRRSARARLTAAPCSACAPFHSERTLRPQAPRLSAWPRSLAALMAAVFAPRGNAPAEGSAEPSDGFAQEPASLVRLLGPDDVAPGERWRCWSATSSRPPPSTAGAWRSSSRCSS